MLNWSANQSPERKDFLFKNKKSFFVSGKPRAKCVFPRNLQLYLGNYVGGRGLV